MSSNLKVEKKLAMPRYEKESSQVTTTHRNWDVQEVQRPVELGQCFPNILDCNPEIKKYILGFPGGAAVENLPANAGDTGLSPGLGRSHMLRSN